MRDRPYSASRSLSCRPQPQLHGASGQSSLKNRHPSLRKLTRVLRAMPLNLFLPDTKVRRVSTRIENVDRLRPYTGRSHRDRRDVSPRPCAGWCTCVRLSKGTTQSVRARVRKNVCVCVHACEGVSSALDPKGGKPVHPTRAPVSGGTKIIIIKVKSPQADKHYQRDVLFWLHLASCYYESKVTQYSLLQTTGVEFITRQNNAPNVPQARDIEIFWPLCKKKYKKYTNIPQRLTSFKHRWTRLVKGVTATSGKAIMKRAAINMRKFGCKGFAGAKVI
ncbi:hypothetical protein EVAR_38773_1 [Eumeta japonica]|uniref:Uncharacterized protein n=1 Tax=Eumeta variegata TaxID=151549 RepID=A0A4C1WM41_EUMVA|nr:hypothetical protein EVAR_38773_1 [Eumeta japonica]